MTSTVDQSAHLVPHLGAGMESFEGLSGGLEGAEMELQKLLFDERMRCETHKANYKTLKTEYVRLEGGFTLAQGELRRMLSDKEAQEEQLQLLLAELQGQLAEKNTELEEIRLKVMTPQRLELLRIELQQEMEAPVRERFNKLEEETEKYRSEYNKARYDCIILQSQLDHQNEEQDRILEERSMHYEVEISCLKRDKLDLVAHYEKLDPLQDGKRVEALLRQKAQLHVRLKGLEAEVAELRGQKESLSQQAENVQHIHSRQQSESQAALKSMEAECQSLRQRLGRMESELRTSQEESRQLNRRLHKSETEVSSLTSEIESLTYSHKQEVANIKLESTRSRAELERERDTLQGQIDGLLLDIKGLETAVERHKDRLVEKEGEMVRMVQSTREEEFRKTATLHEEKLELLSRVAALEKKRFLLKGADHALGEAWEEPLHSTYYGEESSQRELQTLRTDLKQQSSRLKELERQNRRITELQQQNQELRVQVETLTETLDRTREELRTAREQAKRSRHDAERLAGKHQVERAELREREAKLQQKYSWAKEKMKRAAEAQRKRKDLTEKQEKKLQNKIVLLEAKIRELELEVSLAKKCPSSSEREAQLGRQLKALKQRHVEFRDLLLSGQRSYGADNAIRASSSEPVLLPGSKGPSSSLPEEEQRRWRDQREQQEQQEQQERSLLRQRLDNLQSSQQQQLKDLQSMMLRDREPQPDL